MSDNIIWQGSTRVEFNEAGDVIGFWVSSTASDLLGVYSVWLGDVQASAIQGLVYHDLSAKPMELAEFRQITGYNGPDKDGNLPQPAAQKWTDGVNHEPTRDIMDTLLKFPDPDMGGRY